MVGLGQREGAERRAVGQRAQPALLLLGGAEEGEGAQSQAALYGEGGLWVRPAEMWNETVEREGKTFPRFTYIGE